MALCRHAREGGFNFLLQVMFCDDTTLLVFSVLREERRGVSAFGDHT